MLPALVEGVYLDAVVRVLLEDLLGVLVSVEGVHEDQGYVRVVRLVQVLRKRDWKKSNHTHAQKEEECRGLL